MILTKEIKVKNSIRYKKLGYSENDKFVFIKLEDLPLGSSYKILAKCDFCEKEKEISYKDYNYNFKNGNKFACSVKCGCLKSKISNLEKYGVESHLQLEEIKSKIRETNIEKYGVDHVSKIDFVSKSKSENMKSISSSVSSRMKNFYKELSEDDINKINQKRVKTNLEKWGVDNVSKCNQIKDKKRATFNDKWGGFTLESDELLSKVKTTNLEKYGCEYPLQSDSIILKIKENNLKKYGSEYPKLSDSKKQEIKKTNLFRYGVENIMLSEDFRKKFNISKENNYIKYIGKRNYEFFCEECDNNYIIDYDNYYKRKLNNLNTCTICNKISELSSIKEKNLHDFISSIYNKEIIRNYRDGLEIDIYLPDLKIGFEFNGLYWHSNKFKDKNYHLYKKEYFEEKKIKIIHIWEDDWTNKGSIIRSQIKNWIGVTPNKIGARNCEIREINDPIIYKEFLNNNHIQGYIRSIVKLGLYHNGELVSLMTFDNSEGRKKMRRNEWNLSRFCNKIETNIPGSFSKLLNYFINNYNPVRVISFADKDWSDGGIYYKSNFDLINILKPDYKYIINNQRINKQRLTKSKLIKMGYDDNLSESTITEMIGINKVYNCGQLKFELKTKQ